MVLLNLLFNCKESGYLETSNQSALNSIQVNWKSFSSNKCLEFKFGNKFTLSEATDASNRWEHYMESVMEGTKIDLVWDCSQLTSFDTESRVIWQRMLKKYKHKIGNIFLITDSALVQMGADMLAFFTSKRIRTIKTKQQLHKMLRSA